MPAYRRVLLKLSGEALMGDLSYGIDWTILQRVVSEIAAIAACGIQLGLVVGGGNLFRGVDLTSEGMERVTADHIGMLATVMNALAMQDALQKVGLVQTRVMSAIRLDTVCEAYSRRQAIAHLEKNRIVVFAAGTGNPLFTTDTAASLRAIEIHADLLIKATKVDGVYAADPVRYPDAERFARLSYNEVLARQLGVMDLTAILLCRDNNLPLRVLDMGKSNALLHAATGGDEGTLISN